MRAPLAEPDVDWIGCFHATASAGKKEDTNNVSEEQHQCHITL